mgnify:FL=1
MSILILASGSGTLAQALIDSQFDIKAIVSDVADAEVLNRGKRVGIPTQVISFRQPREEWNKELFEYVAKIDPDLVVSVGFMRILAPDFVRRFRVINSHPSLLPNFPGAHAVRDALAANVTETGCTVHWVDEGMDTGEIIAQQSIAIEPDDDLASLHERIKILERKLIVKVVKELEGL